MTSEALALAEMADWLDKSGWPGGRFRKIAALLRSLDTERTSLQARVAELERERDAAETVVGTCRNGVTGQIVRLTVFDPQTRTSVEFVPATTAEASVKELVEGLEPFAGFGDFIEAETEGFYDLDEVEVCLVESDVVLTRFYVGAFRRARALITKHKDTTNG